MMDNSNKVLIVMPSSTSGGAERTLYNLIKGLGSVCPVLLTQRDLFEFSKPLNRHIGRCKTLNLTGGGETFLYPHHNPGSLNDRHRTDIIIKIITILLIDNFIFFGCF